MDEDKKILGQLSELYGEHKTLDGAISNMTQNTTSYDQLNLQRLRKRKLLIKDEIAKLESFLYPDIIA